MAGGLRHMKSSYRLLVGATAMLFAGFWCPYARAENLQDLAQETLSESQLNSARDASARNRNAGNLSRNAGRNSIGKGTRNMNQGRAHHHHPQVNMGAFQIAQGLLGLMASAEAENLGNKDSTIATGLDAITSDTAGGNAVGASISGTGSGASATGETSTTGANAGGASLKISAADLSAPETQQALAQLQEQFGYSPDQVVARLSKGIDPTALFTHAPLNPLTSAEAKAAMAAATGESASTVSAQASADLLVASSPISAADAEAAKASSLRDRLRDALSRRVASSDDSENDYDVSPDVKAALEARATEEAERARREAAAARTEEYDLFQVVHLKYLEREKMMRF